MDYATMMLRDHVWALERSHECLVQETSKTAQKVEVLEHRVDDAVNRDESLEIAVCVEIEQMRQRIDRLERAPRVAKRRRRVTICAS